jgi:protein-S-isoprenylcysteine O-methyltransferase Ste14
METPMTDADASVANPGSIRPARVYLLAVLAGLILQRIWPIRLPGGLVASVVGLILIAVGIVTFVLTARAFASAGTPVPGNQPATAVVRRGPMRISRNPIYLSFSVIQIGIALVVHGGWVLIMLVPPLALMHFVVVPREERFMEAEFGEEYASYRASVRRWI